MKKLAEEAAQLVIEMQRIADNLADYNPGLVKKKVPLEVIQYDAANLARALDGIHSEIGEKIKNEHNNTKDM